MQPTVERRRKPSVDSRDGSGVGRLGSRDRGSGKVQIASFVSFDALRRDEYLMRASFSPAYDLRLF